MVWYELTKENKKIHTSKYIDRSLAMTHQHSDCEMLHITRNSELISSEMCFTVNGKNCLPTEGSEIFVSSS